MPENQSISSTAYSRTHAGRVCVALQATTIAELIERAKEAAAESHFLEFRLDALRPGSNPDPQRDGVEIAEAISQVAQFLIEHRGIAAIATCRRKPNGGGYEGSIDQQISLLAVAARSGFALIDLEIESAEECSGAQFDSLCETAAGNGCALMISYHDFQHASDPDAALARVQRFSPAFIKIVTTAHSLSDSLRLLDWVKQRSGQAQLVGIAMGEHGVVSRILSLRAGSAFTFASATHGNATATGQMTVRTLKDLYRVEQLDQATRIYGVAGSPIAHSLSPLMQNSAFRRERINAVYLPLKADSLEDLLFLARHLPLSGLSVTMPLKQSIMAHLANVDPMTAKMGACNTVRMGADGKLYGFNTDAAGVVRPLEKRIALKDAKVLVLGSGGAARAAVYGLSDKGAKVSLWSRNEAKCRELAISARVPVLRREQIAAYDFDVLINATPCGMHGNAHPLPLEANEWSARLVFDFVYNPLNTPLLKAARARNIPTIQGFEMFVHQGARQFEIWTGKAAPEAEMLRVVLHALKNAEVQSSQAAGDR